MAAPKATSRIDRIFSRDQIEGLIADGRKIVILDGSVVKADAWLPFHPGGSMAILHMIGRDATLEIRAFHSAETQDFMKKYVIGKIDGAWIDFIPPIQGGHFRTAAEINASTHTRADSSDSSPQSSSPASPLFEPAEYASTELRSRKRARGESAVSHSSSATSLSLLEIEEKEQEDKVNLTQKELDHDLATYPDLDVATQANIIRKYQELDQRIRDLGLYDCDYSAYGIEALRYLALAGLSFFLLKSGWVFFSAIALGLLWHQLVFTVHDAGHMGITHNFQVDTCIGIFIADFIGGLSVCWWKRNHNVHHIVTNSAEHDPDIQHMPFFAISHRFFENLKSTYYDRIMEYDAVARFTLRYQHLLYYPILALGRFNLYFLSWQYIILGQGPRKGAARWHRYLEAAGQIFFWYWFGYLTVYKSIPSGWQRFMFVMVSHAVTMPVHVQITLSHFAMSTSDLGVAESFPQRMIRTTMDVDCPSYLDFLHGGLQFQAIHHLYPRIPRHNLRKCQGLVIDFCKEVDIPYVRYGFTEGNQKVLSRLGEIAKQARIMAECQQSIAVHDVLAGH